MSFTAQVDFMLTLAALHALKSHEATFWTTTSQHLFDFTSIVVGIIFWVVKHKLIPTILEDLFES